MGDFKLEKFAKEDDYNYILSPDVADGQWNWNRTSLQIQSFCLWQLEKNGLDPSFFTKYTDDEDARTMRFEMDDLRNYFGKEYKAFPAQIQKAADQLTDFKLIVQSKSGNFFYVNVFSVAGVYVDDETGKKYFSFMLDKDFIPYCGKISGQLALFSFETELKLKGSCSIKLYKILKGHCFDSDGKILEGLDVYRVYFDVVQLRMMLGAIDARNKKVKDIVNANKELDYETLLDKIERAAMKEENKENREAMMPKWSDWRNFSKVLAKAVDEINDVSEIYVDMEINSGGTGGRVSGVTFSVYDKRNYKTIEEQIEEQAKPKSSEPSENVEDCGGIVHKRFTKEADDSLVDENARKSLVYILSMEMLPDNISEEQCRQLLELANWNAQIVKSNYELFHEANSKGSNKKGFGWLIRAVENNYAGERSENEEKQKKASNTRNEKQRCSAKKPVNVDNYSFKPLDQDEILKRALEEE